MNTYAHILSGSAYRLGTVSATTEMRVSFPQEEIVASSTSYTYNSAGQPTHVESYINDELVSTTIMSYDSAGRLTMRKSAPRGSRVNVGDEYGYSSSTGLLDSSWDEYGRWTEYMSCDKYGNPAWLWNENEYWRTDFSYDAWGRTRSTTNWSLYEYSDPQTLLYRGYAGYPALQTLGLYHASARIYDPLTGRFLGYDPVVQDPNNSQNWNSYAYCLNNPFRYTDPDGRFIGTALTAVSQFFVAFARGIVEPYFVAFSDTAKAGRMFEEAWSDYGHKVSNAFGIDKGLFVTDSNLSFAERILSVISRFTWELPQTIIGNGISHFRNCTSDISVDYYNGATLVNADNNGSRWGG